MDKLEEGKITRNQLMNSFHSVKADPSILKKIFLVWVPLSARWIIMSVGNIFLTAVIARLRDAKGNLAAFGLAFSFALVFESPIIMILSVSTALVKDKDSFKKIRNYAYVCGGLLTICMIFLLVPAIFRLLTLRLRRVPENIVDRVFIACLSFLPWTGAIVYRRVYQGILIRHNEARKVPYGAILRLSGMALCASTLFFL